MRTTFTIRMFLSIAVSCLTFSLSAVEPTITDVSVRQRWPWNRLVDIDYVLICDATNRVNVSLSAYNNNEPMDLPAESLSGDLYGVEQGARKIVWDPSKSAYTNEPLTQFRVSLSSTLTPSYMIVNLTDGQVSYRYDWNIWYDVTNRTEYMTTNLVLRHILPGTFMMGTPAEYLSLKLSYTKPEDYHQVTLTKGFYISIFETTQKQWALMMNNAWPSYFTNAACADSRPVENVTYSSIRGTATNQVDANSFAGKLNTLVGLDFDLPTEAQWEYACRAGTDTPYNDGITSPTPSTVALLARFRDNNNTAEAGTNRNVDVSCGTARVGTYRPNRWGLYDMHGNVWELCFDGLVDNLGTDPVIDPSFNATGSNKMIHASAWSEDYHNQRSATRLGVGQTSYYSNMGFRIKAADPAGAGQ